MTNRLADAMISSMQVPYFWAIASAVIVFNSGFLGVLLPFANRSTGFNPAFLALRTSILQVSLVSASQVAFKVRQFFNMLTINLVFPEPGNPCTKATQCLCSVW